MKQVLVTSNGVVESPPTVASECTSTFLKTETDIPYNNLGFPPDFFPIGIGSEFKLGQQFKIRDHNSLDEVTLSLFKEGLPLGLLQVEIWTDYDFQCPDQYLGTLGVVNASALSVTGDFFSFSNPVVNLKPQQSYWIVLNFEATQVNFDAGIGWTTITKSDNLQRTKAVIQGKSTGKHWKTLADCFGFPEMSYLQMLVVTSSRC